MTCVLQLGTKQFLFTSVHNFKARCDNLSYRNNEGVYMALLCIGSAHW